MGTNPPNEEAMHISSFVYVTLTEAKWVFDEKKIVLKMKHVQIIYWIISVELLNTFKRIDFGAAREGVAVRAGEMEMQHESIYAIQSLDSNQFIQ